MSTKAIWEEQMRTFIRVLVKPGSKSKKFVEEISKEFIVINLKSAAKEGKANKELVKRLSKIFHVSTANVAIVSGYKSKEKIVMIEGIRQQDVLQRLEKVQ